MIDKWKELFGAEWEKIKRYGGAIVDPDDKKVFWDTIKEAKMRDPHWSFESIFPTKKNATERAREECAQYIQSLRRPKKEKDVE